MAILAGRRPVMTLFSNAACPQSHRVRLVLAEKGISADVVEVGDGTFTEDLVELNPYGSVPTLVDRDLVLYNTQIIMEYLEDRYPHPPLMPVDPVARARVKLYIYRMERDWYSLLEPFVTGEDEKAAQVRNVIRDGLTVIAPIFEQKPFFMSDELTLADYTLLPLLWRLPSYNIELPASAQAVLDYAERLFARAPFKRSMSAAERELRPSPA
ncbi:MAG: glutathione S-transferase N-terminal domain-containing protein [Gammaproteobacteria bacterium]|jgi:RNA polymerase-associated protein